MTAFVMTLSLGVEASAASEDAILQLQLELAALVDDDGAPSAKELEDRVSAGLPPTVLVAVLDACREHPRGDLEALVRGLGRHRSAPIRARALLALAEFGPTQSLSAIRAAADDHSRGVRRLALVLQRLHPSPRADAIAAELLDKDHVLAAESAEQGEVSTPTESTS